MSSPLASLSKTRRAPLPSETVIPGRHGIRIYGDGTGHRLLHRGQGPGPAFPLGFGPRAVIWASLSAEDEADMLNDGHGLEERIPVPSCYGSIVASVSRQGLASHDSDLMVSMTRKLQDLERQVKSQTAEMLSKDQKILALEDLVQSLQQHQGEVTLQRQEELETMCMQLRRQVEEMEVSDLRHQIYLEDGLGPFPGEGRMLGRQRMHKASDRMEHSGSRTTAEKFLNRLPKCVIRQGEDIRGPIRDTLQNYCPFPARIQEIVVETPALAAERERSQKSPGMPAPPLCMLRIKSENGEQAFLLMMRPEDTVGDVCALLAQVRARDAAACEIFSTFPPTVYDNGLTLQAAGLVPNAALMLRARRALPSAPEARPSLSPSLGLGPSPE